MENVISLPQTDETTMLAPASGAPRPLTVRHFRSLDEGPYAPVIRLKPRTPARRDETADLRAVNAHGDAFSVPRQISSADHRTVEEVRRLTGIVRSVTQAAFEVLGGTRPIQQLSRWLDPKSFERLRIRSTLVREAAEQRASSADGPVRLHRRAAIRSSRLCRLSATAYEASLVVAESARVRAVAVRLELVRGQWKVTALEIG